MFEVELSLTFFALGIFFSLYLLPKVIMPKLKERFSQEETHTPTRRYSECEFCHSKTYHRTDCPNNPKNKVKT